MSTWQGNVLRGTRAAQPAATGVVVGALYFVTDEGVTERSTGAAWESYSPTTVGGNVTAAGTLTSNALVIGQGSKAVATTATAAGIVTFLGTPSSANLAAALTDETGSGLAVFGTSPTITTPTISGAITFPDNVRQTFNPGADQAGLNVGSIAGDPGTPTNGDVWYDSTANELTARINGANVSLGAGGGTDFGFTAPVTGDFSWINQGGAAVSSAAVWGTTADYLTIPASGGDNIRLRVKSAPAPPYTLTVAFIASFPVANFFLLGPAWRESGTGEIFVIGPNMDGTFAQARGYKATSATATPSVQAMTIPNFALSAPWIYWMRLEDDNTDRTVYWSPDGTNWLEIFTEPRTTFLTPDQLGWGGYISNASFGCQMTLLSWLQA